MLNPSVGYASCVYDVNQDNVTRIAYFDAAGKAMNGPDGWAVCSYTYAGTTTTRRYTCADGTPFVNKKGYSGISQVKKGSQVVEEYYLDGAGKPVITSDGYAGWKKTYASGGKIGMQVYLGKDGNPINVPSLGYAQFNRTYSRGLLTEEIYYDADHRKTDCAEGYHRVVYTYGDKKRLAEEWYYGSNGSLTSCSGGYAGKVYEYDFSGRTTKVIYYSSNKSSQAASDEALGASEVRTTYAGGKEATVSYYLKGKPTLNSEGYFRKESVFDKGGRLTSRSWYGPDGSLINTANGYAMIEYAYDPQGRQISVRYYTADMALMTPKKTA